MSRRPDDDDNFLIGNDGSAYARVGLDVGSIKSGQQCTSVVYIGKEAFNLK